MGKYNIKRTAAILIIVTIIEKLLGFGREMVIASQFGASGLTDAYNAGYLIPYFIMALLNAGLVNVYAPVFISEMEVDKDKAWDKMNSISTYLMIILFVLTIVGILFSEKIVGFIYSGFEQDKIKITASISKLFFIGVFIYSGSIIEGSLLNCFRSFVYPIISISLLSISTIIWVLLFGGTANINSIAQGYIAGALVAVVMQYIKIRSISNRFGINFKPYPQFARKFFGLLFPVLIATSISQANVFVGRIFASYLPSGSMSYLNYGNKVVELPITLFSTIIATIIFPDIIECINKKDDRKLKIYVNKAIVTTLIFLIPSFAGLCVLNKEIIKLIYQRNMFTSENTINTASALLYYSPTIIMYGCTAIISKIYYSMKDTITLMNISIFTIVLNGVLDYILMRPMAHNGLALATSIVSVFQFAAAYVVLKKKVDISMGSYLPKNILKISASSIVMAVLLIFLKHYFRPASLAVFVMVSIILGASLYFIMLVIFRVDELDLLKSRLKFKTGRK